VTTKSRFFFSLIGLIAGIIVLIFLVKINNIHCFIDNQLLDSAQVCIQLQSLKGGRILLRNLADEKEVLEKLFITETQEIYTIKSIQASLNGSLTFNLETSPPLYRLERHGELLLFNKSGQGRKNDDRVILPLVIDKNGLFEKDFNLNHSFLAGFLTNLGEDLYRIEEIRFISPTMIRIVFKDFLDFLVEPQQNPQQQALRLQRVLHNLNPNQIDLSLQEIDLRFDLPVMRSFESSDSADFPIDSLE